MLQAPLIQTESDEMKLSVVRISCREREFPVFNLGRGWFLSQLVPKKHDDEKIDLLRCKSNQFMLYECGWSTGGFPCI